MCNTEPVATVNPRSITDVERPWLDAMIIDPAGTVDRLQSGLRQRGHSSARILGLTGWIVTKANGLRDDADQATKARYRAILRDLDLPQFAAA